MDAKDRARFNAATRVHLGNGPHASWKEMHPAHATLFTALLKHSKRKVWAVKVLESQSILNLIKFIKKNKKI